MSSILSRSLHELVEELAQAVVIADPADQAALPPILETVRTLEERLGGEGHGSLLELLVKGTRPLVDAVAKGSNSTGALAAAAATVSLIQNGLRDGKGIGGKVPVPAAAPAPAVPASAAAPVLASPAPTSASAGGRVERDAETVEVIADFLQESGDGLAKADDILVAVEQGGSDPEQINALFRVFHTIKGVAGFLDFVDVASLAHTTETLLNLVREGKLALEGPPLDAVFDATALMRSLLDGVRTAVEAGLEVPGEPELPALVARLEEAIAGEGAAEPAAAPAPAAPPVAEAAIEAPVADEGEEPDEAAEEPAEAGPALAPAVRTSVAPAAAAAAPSAAPVAGAPAAKIRETLKVDLERVDQMVEMIGELIIVESMVVHAPEVVSLQSLGIRKQLSQLTKISRDLQDVAMRMRMVPVRGVFQKMNRLVRELSRRTGKDTVLVTTGEATEMDRSMVERIEDPLVHMIRNSMDHGIEGPDERRAAGKSSPATIRLSAFHEGGSVVIEVGDDGRGLARGKILAKAIAKGLVRESENLSDADVYNLIFAPGFSTAAQVTEISGRGVGMDVVKRNVEGMRGRVSIASTPGEGTTFRMVLPLTLAIIDGMLVSVGSERYIIPSLSIVESLQPKASMLNTLGGQDELINVRGEILPLYRLSKLFAVEGAREDPTEALIVVVESLGRKIGLLVDDVLTQQQVVIKPLGNFGIRDSECFSGAAILSDGRVGLILNVDRIQRPTGRHGHGAERSSEEETA